MKPTIVVTGATGSTGSQVIGQLLARDWLVRALVRQVDARAERLHSLGAQVVVTDLFDPGQVMTALRGAQRAYFCPPTHPHMLDSAAVFAIAVQQAKLDTVVVLSQWLASAAHPLLLTRRHYLADHLFAATPGLAHITVNPGFFAPNYLETIAFAAQLGVLPKPMGDSRNAPPSNADIAAVAVGALTGPARHDGRTYRPTGPDLLDATEMATILAGVLNRTVRAVPMPAFLIAKAMRTFGFDAFMTAQTRTYVAEHRAGTFAYGGPTDDVHQVTGRPPESFEATARNNTQLLAAQRNAAQFVRVLATLARTGITPGGNPRHPHSRHPRYLTISPFCSHPTNHPHRSGPHRFQLTCPVSSSARPPKSLEGSS